MRWKDLSILKKLSISFGFIGLLLILISSVSGLGFITLSEEIDQNISLTDFVDTMLQREIDHIGWQVKVLSFLLDDKAVNLTVKTDDHACKLGKWLYGDERRQAEALLPGIASTIKAIEIPHKNLHDSAKNIQNAVTKENGLKKAAIVIYNEKSLKALKAVRAGLHDIVHTVEEHLHEETIALQADVKVKIRTITTLSILAILLGLIFCFFLSRAISSSLKQSVDFAKSMADRDLTKRLDLQQKDELGLLATALNTMAEKFNSMIGKMNGEVLNLTSTSND